MKLYPIDLKIKLNKFSIFFFKKQLSKYYVYPKSMWYLNSCLIGKYIERIHTGPSRSYEFECLHLMYRT